MATWGGSTAGNLESIEENENRSNNETGDDDADDGDNEKDDDDDEDESGKLTTLNSSAALHMVVPVRGGSRGNPVMTPSSLSIDL